MDDNNFTLLDLVQIGKLSYRTKELSLSEKTVLVEMSHICTDGLSFFQQTKSFADDIGMNHRQVQMAIKSLCEKGFIKHKCYDSKKKVHKYLMTFHIGENCLIPFVSISNF